MADTNIEDSLSSGSDGSTLQVTTSITGNTTLNMVGSYVPAGSSPIPFSLSGQALPVADASQVTYCHVQIKSDGTCTFFSQLGSPMTLQTNYVREVWHLAIPANQVDDSLLAQVDNDLP